MIRLAALYECRVADLMIDCEDFRHHDVEYRARAALAPLPALVMRDSRGAVGLPSGESDSSTKTEDEPLDFLVAFIEKVDEMSTEELAQTVASWAGQVDAGMSRRRLLLKLSAGLSLAAADPVLTVEDERNSDHGRQVRSGDDANLVGIWHSRYTYYSSGQDKELYGEHYVVLRQQANRLTGQSLPHSKNSRMKLNLFVEGSIAMGTWIEQTSPQGYYKGAVYHGTMQLIINPMGRAMSGRWLGFGKNFKINTGEWELTWVDGSTSRRVMRQYHYKA